MFPVWDNVVNILLQIMLFYFETVFNVEFQIFIKMNDKFLWGFHMNAVCTNTLAARCSHFKLYSHRIYQMRRLFLYVPFTRELRQQESDAANGLRSNKWVPYPFTATEPTTITLRWHNSGVNGPSHHFHTTLIHMEETFIALLTSSSLNCFCLVQMFSINTRIWSFRLMWTQPYSFHRCEFNLQKLKHWFITSRRQYLMSNTKNMRFQHTSESCEFKVTILICWFHFKNCKRSSLRRFSFEHSFLKAPF